MLIGLPLPPNKLIGEPREERAERKEERLAACGALWADDYVAFLQKLAYHGGIGGAVTTEAESWMGEMNSENRQRE
ncbi:hypothetical protein F511_32898 [Dorcoceras hygrometricum]|uniref:Uncharacterized protein n=1 Tax=Dorcoceras hygrometricum TaxID=472368 RepID=A0A2Z7ANT8_9LAMI|nr:hypothetical protein F511_32898 [Dorcoceras hygrometricum]